MKDGIVRGRRVWAEINLDNIIFNYAQARKLARDSEMLCVIKADAYGHGAPQIAKALSGAGADRFAVATAEEALQLRRYGFNQMILILGAVDPESVRLLALNNIQVTINGLEAAEAYAKKLGAQRIGAHIKYDSGMSRMGLLSGDAVEHTLRIAKMLCFSIEGAFTHLAAADTEAERQFTAEQIARFNNITAELASRGFKPSLRHFANSAGIISSPAPLMDMARPGIMLYGYNPCDSARAVLKPALSLYTNIVQIKTLPPGESVSYGRVWRSEGSSVIATAAVGYADGLFRALSGKTHMLVHGRKARQVGRICMDMCMLDVTDIQNVKVGDTAVIIGADGGESITADDIAETAGTISYEILCGVGRRVPRAYIKDNRVVEDICYVNIL
ncbi:MAG: alanine racemase [Clostridiales bacterium]|jgi:alanine racemase|nr:alanine racemase [Clostridiales bacterium]